MNKAEIAISIGQLFLLILNFINYKSMNLYRCDSLPFCIKYLINYLLSIIIIILMIINLSI